MRVGTRPIWAKLRQIHKRSLVTGDLKAAAMAIIWIPATAKKDKIKAKTKVIRVKRGGM